MDEAIDLLQLFVDGKIDADTFAGDFIVLWREFCVETDVAMKAQGLWQESVQLTVDGFSEKISTEDFSRRYADVCNRVKGVRLTPISKESTIISHIMVECDAYTPNLELRASDPRRFIGEEELLTEVRKAVDELKAIRSANEQH